MTTDCNWTEKVSLLIDGELAAGEARAVELHLGDCFACRLAREDFLLLRHQLSSYRPEVNLLAQSRALASILDTGASAQAADADGHGRRATGRRGRLLTDWRTRVAGVFTLPRLGPAVVAASALLLVALALGLVMLRRDERPANELARNAQPAASASPAAAAPAQPGANPATQPGLNSAAPSPDEVSKIQPRGAGSIGGSKARDGGAQLAKGPKPKGTNDTNLIDRRGSQGASAQLASVADSSSASPSASSSADADDLPLILPARIPVESGRAAADDAATAELASFAAAEPAARSNPATLSAARHAEQAQQLLRSFRNAGGESSADLSYERERSQTLLYQNIVLRREAASRGNVAVESVLGSLEPILVDIANLPEKPAREDVRTISERMKKKDIVAMLQIAARD